VEQGEFKMRQTSDVKSIRRAGSAEVYVVAALSLAVLLGAGLFYKLSLKREIVAQVALADAENQAVEAKRQAVEAEAMAKADAERADAERLAATNAKSAAKQIGPAEQTDPVAELASADAADSNVADVPKARSMNVRETILAHLEFGEYNNAIQLANNVTDKAQRSELLALVADAQIEIGDFSAALGSIRRIPVRQQQSDARDRHTAQQAVSGGAQADFGPLIALIQSETSGDWEELDGEGGTISEFEQGVRVDPQGVLSIVSEGEQADRLKELGIRARNVVLNKDIAQTSGMRVVSLTRLERAVAKRIAEGKNPVESQKLLGGLTRISNVFIYPNSGEVVLVGPAESWTYNENGVPVGSKSGRPILRLDDLVTCLRAFSTNKDGYFSCSINPRPAGLKSLKDFVASSSSRPLSPGAGVRRWVAQLQQKLGRQDIVYKGIDPTSRVARVIVEADYRMKLVGIGKYDFGKGTKIPSIFDLMTVEEQKAGKLDVLRWWLSMKYDSVLHSADGNSYEFVGSSVLCQSENQFLNAQGQQVPTGKSDGSNRVFAETFTTKYSDIAKHDLVFADLRNVFDLALVASLLEHKHLARKASWDFGAFAEGGSYNTAIHAAPKEVDSIVNHRVFRGKEVVAQVAGGVRVDMAVAYNDKVFRQGVRLESTSAKAKVTENLADRNWWWDAK
jgi:hypothetical protein